MLTRTFEHEGVTFTVRQPTIFDEEMETVAWIDLCRVLAQDKGLPDMNDLPHVQQRLTKRYVQWMQVTTINEITAWGDVYTPNSNHFQAWRDAILMNGQALALKWSKAYADVTQDDVDTDEKKDGVSNGHVSDGSPETVPAETS